MFVVITDMMELKNNLRTNDAQIVQKLKNEARPKFIGSYKKKACIVCFVLLLCEVVSFSKSCGHACFSR